MNQLAADTSSPALPITIQLSEPGAEGPAFRGMCFGLDSILVAVPSAIAAAGIAIGTGRSGDLFAAGAVRFAIAYLVVGALLQLAYSTLTEGLWGRTLGKLVGGWPASLRVLRLDGGPIGFREAFLRAAVGLLEANMALGPLVVGAMPAWIVLAARKDRRRLGDLAAGTAVCDTAKLLSLTLDDAGASLTMADDRLVRLATLDRAAVTTWLGRPQTVKLGGAGPDGCPISVRFRGVTGMTVWSQPPSLDVALQWLQWRFSRPLDSSVQWWRIAVIGLGVVMMPLAFLAWALGRAISR